MRALTIVCICLLLAMALPGCGGGEGGAGTIAGRGTIRQFFVEGGGFRLVDDTGTSYLPENLTSAFQQDGLRVSYSGHLTGASSAQQVGAVLHIDEIHTL